MEAVNMKLFEYSQRWVHQHIMCSTVLFYQFLVRVFFLQSVFFVLAISYTCIVAINAFMEYLA